MCVRAKLIFIIHVLIIYCWLLIKDFSSTTPWVRMQALIAFLKCENTISYCQNCKHSHEILTFNSLTACFPTPYIVFYHRKLKCMDAQEWQNELIKYVIK